MLAVCAGAQRRGSAIVTLRSNHPCQWKDSSICALCGRLQVVDPVAAAQPAARSKDLMRAMKEAAQGMRGGREVRLGLAVRLCRSISQLCVGS